MALGRFCDTLRQQVCPQMFNIAFLTMAFAVGSFRCLPSLGNQKGLRKRAGKADNPSKNPCPQVRQTAVIFS